MLRPGDSFLLPALGQSTPHLWIVITEADADGWAVCVNKPSSETTVILNPGDHPFITHESVVYYKDADKLNLRTVESAINRQSGFVDIVCQQHQPCSAALLQRIQEGLLASPLVKKGIKEYCRTAWNK